MPISLPTVDQTPWKQDTHQFEHAEPVAAPAPGIHSARTESAIPSIPPTTSLTNRRATTMEDLMQMRVPSELIVQVLDNMREEEDAFGGSSQPVSTLSRAVQPLPMGSAASPPPGYDFKG